VVSPKSHVVASSNEKGLFAPTMEEFDCTYQHHGTRAGDLEIWIERCYWEDTNKLTIVIGVRSISVSPRIVLRNIQLEMALCRRPHKECIISNTFSVHSLRFKEEQKIFWRGIDINPEDVHYLCLEYVSFLKNLKYWHYEQKDLKNSVLCDEFPKIPPESRENGKNPYTIQPLSFLDDWSEKIFQDPFWDRNGDGLCSLLEKWYGWIKQVDDQMDGGKGYLVVLEGDFGGGKTTLLSRIYSFKRYSLQRCNIGNDLLVGILGEKFILDDCNGIHGDCGGIHVPWEKIDEWVRPKTIIMLSDEPFVQLEQDSLNSAIQYLVSIVRQKNMVLIITANPYHARIIRESKEKIESQLNISIEVTRIPWLNCNNIVSLLRINKIPFDASLPNFVWRWSGGHPLLTQIILQVVYTLWHSSGYLTFSGFEIVMREIFSTYSDVLGKLWGSFTEEEQEVFFSIAYWYRVHHGPVSKTDVLSDLMRRSNPTFRVAYYALPHIVLDGLLYGTDAVVAHLEETLGVLRALREVVENILDSSLEDRRIEADKRNLWRVFTGLESPHFEKIVRSLSRIVSALKRMSSTIDDLPIRDRQKALAYWEQVLDEEVRTPLLSVLEWDDKDIWQLLSLLDSLAQEYESTSWGEDLTKMKELIYKLSVPPQKKISQVLQDLQRRGWLMEDNVGNLSIRPHLLYLWLAQQEHLWAKRLAKPEG